MAIEKIIDSINVVKVVLDNMEIKSLLFPFSLTSFKILIKEVSKPNMGISVVILKIVKQMEKMPSFSEPYTLEINRTDK